MTAELSRGELLAWVNELTGLNLPKIESMGTGAAHCLIVDSVFGEVPLHKVNFKAIHEYEYVQNFKVLQESFTRNRIDRVIPVDRLIKLKFQDNLEFLQWMKKFWDAHYDGSAGDGYDASKRRSECGGAVENKKTSVAVASSRRAVESAPANRPAPNAATRPAATTQTNSLVADGAGSQSKTTAVAPNAIQLAALTKTITELKLSVDEMEKERDFYFSKLRDIEILTQKVTDSVMTGSVFFKQITEILYTTEDGFEIPQDGEAHAVGAVQGSSIKA